MSTNYVISKPYTIFIDYGRSVEEGIMAGGYEWFSSDITSKNFPPKQPNKRGKVEVKMELINATWRISTDEVLYELDRMGYRPAELQELLAFSEKYSITIIQHLVPIVALGSIWEDLYGFYHVPYLDIYHSGRALYLKRISNTWREPWPELTKFAAIRKQFKVI